MSATTGRAATSASIELTIDGQPGPRRRRRDDARRLCRGRRRHARRCATAPPHAGERVPRVRRRGRGLARAGAGLLAPGRAGMVRAHRHRARGPPRRLVLELLGSSVDLSVRPRGAALDRSATAPTPTRFGGDDVATRGEQPAQGRQRPLRPRLRQVHPLLQVRRRLRRRVAEHVRHRRRRTRLRRPHLAPSTTCRCPTRPASTAATASACAPPAR